MAEETNGSVTSVNISPSTPDVPKQQERPHVVVDDSKTAVCYANFCRVTGAPEELIVDFGTTSQLFGVPTQPIAVTQRVVASLYTAKRLLQALQLAVQRHEAVFGALETDIQKRMRRA